MEPVWYTLLGTSKQHRICGYIVISDMMFYDFIGICFLILGGKPIGFYLQEHRFYFFLFDCFCFICFFVFGVLLFGDGSRVALCHSWFLRVC